MIPRAKYRAVSQPSNNPVRHKSLDTFATDEQRLIDYLDDSLEANPKQGFNNTDRKEANYNLLKQSSELSPSGALISAGFQVDN